MEILNNYLFWLIIFLISGFFIYNLKRKKNEIQAQFVITTGILIIIFYIVCFLSGVCTILNFIWNWFY